MTPEPASYLIVNHCEAKIGVIEVEVKRDAPHHNQSNGQLNNLGKKIYKLDLAFNNVKPKDWYFDLD